jgi:DNA helicase HerA-like ATPase
MTVESLDNYAGQRMNPLARKLTHRFYEWEKRGRGWKIWDKPVEIEPPFRPFRHQPFYDHVDDDGRRHTLVSRLLQKISASSCEPQIQTHKPLGAEGPTFIADEFGLVEIQVTLPVDMDSSPLTAEHFLMNLAHCEGSISFEIVGTSQAIVLQFVCREADCLRVRRQLKAHFPDAMLTEERDYLTRHLSNQYRANSVIADFGLSNEFMRPILTFRKFASDPVVGITGAIDSLEENEVGLLQVLFQPVRYPWAESILHSVTGLDGKDFFADAPEMRGMAQQKTSRPLYAAVVRVAAQSLSNGRSWDIVRSIGAALGQFADPISNEFVPLENDSYSLTAHREDMLQRRSQRCGMILNSDELVGLVHLPSPSVKAERMCRRALRSKVSPSIVHSGEIVLGSNEHNGKTSLVALKPEHRVRHTYVVGASGTGKSTFLLNTIIQDIENGHGLGVLDPHGDLISDIIERIPERRHKDVVLVDPSDESYPIGFNILSAHSELEKILIASDMVAMFRRLSTSWGDQMTTVLSNAVLAFLESDQAGTLSDLRRFLVEKDFRRKFLATVKDRDIVYYWEKEFPLLSGRPQGPILTRLDAFLRPKIIRHMVSQRENRLDFADIMNGKKIFLARLAQGAIGEENAYVLGTLLVSKFHQITLSRQEIMESRREPFYLYIDEFHNFVTPSMASILSSVRKYRLGLILAHQELRQLEKRDAEVAGAALSNPYTRVCFRVGELDAKKLAAGLSFFESTDLLNLGTGEAICRVERADHDFNLRVPLPDVINKDLATKRRESVRAVSRGRYGTPKKQIQDFLDRQWSNSQNTGQREKKEPKAEKRPNEPPVVSVPELPVTKPLEETEIEPAIKSPRSTPTSTLMGKGGQEHKYLQNLIKRWTEGMGYRAIIEKELENGASIDVYLDKGEISIACEIAVTTTPDHEWANIRKCLAVQPTYVVAVSTDSAKLVKIEKLAADKLGAMEGQKIKFLSPEELFHFIQEIEADAAATEHTVRGYKVRVKYGAPGEAEQRSRKRAVSRVILDVLAKRKERTR